MHIGNWYFDQDMAMAILQKVAMAVIILLVTWALAKGAKWAFAKLVDNISFLQRHTETGQSIGTSLGKIVSLFIWLFGLLAILNVFNLDGVMAPLQTLLNDVMEFIPNLVGASLVFFIGLMVARIVRDITVTALEAANFDKWLNKGGVDRVTGNNALSKTVGTIIYVLIVIPVSIAALGALNIATISGPASEMLSMILSSIPLIIGAVILLGIGYLISKFVMQILEEVLSGLGFDRSVAALGLLPESASASKVVGRVTQVAIILFFAIAATRLLGFPELTAILDEILLLGGSVIFGGAVILAGYLLANMLGRLMSGADSSATLAGTVVRWTTMVLFTFMGLQFMGVGEEIVQLAFGALVLGGAVAGALAFGLGGRTWAAKKLEELDRKTGSDK
ncbi:MAG: mechanosensitive ion channel [Sphingomonadaceae bacterium]